MVTLQLTLPPYDIEIIEEHLVSLPVTLFVPMFEIWSFAHDLPSVLLRHPLRDVRIGQPHELGKRRVRAAAPA